MEREKLLKQENNQIRKVSNTNVNSNIQELKTFKLYFPLYSVIDRHDFEYQHMDELESLDMSEMTAFAEEILNAINVANERFDNDRGLAEYINNEELKAKVYSMHPTLEINNGLLFGVMKCKLTSELDRIALEQLKAYVSGQNSDGYGEGFEQRPIETSHGDIYVSFWSSNDDYYIDTEQEHINRLDDSIKMQGMNM